MTIEERVLVVAAESLYLDREAVAAQMSLHDNLAMDSLDLVDFVMEIEDEFQIEISDETCSSFITLQDVIDYVTEVKK